MRTVELKIEEEPESAELIIKKGNLLEKSGEHEKAASAYDKGVIQKRTFPLP